jgi:peptide chain release factor 2
VRVTHLPTGLSADVHHERSQHRNDALALRLLAARLWVFREDQTLPEGDRLYGVGGGVRPGRHARRYTLAPSLMVQDPRTGARTADVGAVLDGDLRVFMMPPSYRGRP